MDKEQQQPDPAEQFDELTPEQQEELLEKMEEILEELTEGEQA